MTIITILYLPEGLVLGSDTQLTLFVKGTLVESILGVVYQEFGLKKLLSIAPYIQ